MVQPKTRTKIIDAMIALAAERPFNQVTLEAIAQHAGVPLATLRAAYDTRLDVLADFVRRTDERVLAGLDADMAEEGFRDRLFDVLFSRLEALAPHKAAIENIGAAACRDPALALALNRIEILAMAWMLSAAGISATGPRGLFRAQGLVAVWACVLRVWLADDDPALSRTMAALDRRLRQAEGVVTRVDRLCEMAACFGGGRRAPKPAPSGADLAEGHPS